MSYFSRINSNTKRPVAILAIAIVTGVLSGCSSHELGTAPVHGVVTLDGQPLDQGLVLFRPDKGRMAAGNIQPDGSYVLFTYVKNGKDGAIVGHHQVSVSPSPTMSETTTAVVTKQTIPKRYGMPDTSTLEFNVEAGKDNVYNIELLFHEKRQ